MGYLPHELQTDRSDADRGMTSTILERLKGLHPKVIDLSLERVWRLLAAVGDPHRHLPPVVHVAGTNGKGSTVAFLRAMLEAAGARVHVYTSPHLVHFHERIRLAGTLIDDAALAAVLAECEAANQGHPITFFEITTVAALLAFARTPADVVLLETGLGGRLDATNVIPRPAVTAITRISCDHTQYLGDTLTAIAGEKAGIMKPGVPVVLAPQTDPAVWDTLLTCAARTGAPTDCNGRDWLTTAADNTGLRFQRGPHWRDLPHPALTGAHQIANAGTALACLDHLAPMFPVPPAAQAQGLRDVCWPARLQHLTHGPLCTALPADWELWLDGGHNDSAGEVLATQAACWQASDSKPLNLIFAMLASKRPADFLRPLRPWVRAVRAVGIPGEEMALPASETAAIARDAGFTDTATTENPLAALYSLVTPPGPPARVLICGSLYLAGTVLADNG